MKRKIIKDIKSKTIPYTVVFLLIATTLTGMFLILPTVNSAYPDTFSEDYEDDNIGSYPTDTWYSTYIIPFGEQKVTGDEALSGSKSQNFSKIASIGSGRFYYNFTIESNYTYVNFSFYIYNDTHEETGVEIGGCSMISARIFIPEHQQDHNIITAYISAGVYVNTTLGFKNETWQNISIVHNFTTNKFSVINDSGAQSIWYNFYNSATSDNISFMRILSSYNEDQAMYFDNLNVEHAGANSPPVNTIPIPTNGATGEDLNPTLSIDISDADSNTMNQTFWTNASGTWTAIGYNNNSGDATVSNSTTCFPSYSTKYWWNSSVEDGNGNWDNDTYYFTTKDEWSGSWSEGWDISNSHSCSGTGYEYGNWSFSEHVADGTLDEAWTTANDSHWNISDESSWWSGNYTYYAFTTGINHTMAVLNNSGTNRSQGFGWVHHNDTDVDYLYPYIIFAYNGSQDYDLIMWSTYDVWALHWNGTNMTDIATGASVVYPADDAAAINDQWIQEGVYLRGEGNYYKYIYNELAGTIKFKWWGNGAFNEPDGWAAEFQHTNITHTGARCHGIGFWNPFGRATIMQWDLMNLWQLNYTVNTSAWCNISGYNESRPHMDFPVIDIGTWTEEISYFNGIAEGNLSVDLVRSIMKDNITNNMNMESRMFEMKAPGTGQQNDTVYYYSCLIDNYTSFDPESPYDEWLHLHVQMCPEQKIDTDEYGDIIVAIDVDNDHTWDANDRFYWSYADDTYTSYDMAFNGNGDGIPPIYSSGIWQTDSSAVGNLHRYNSHLNYVLNIPLADLITDVGVPLNVSNVFGLSIITTMSGSLITEIPAVWQNWNETSETPFWDEETTLGFAMDYFLNGTGEEEGGLPNSTTIGRWGEGVISDSFDASGDINYNMSINASFNDTSSESDESYALVNVTINVTNNGAGNLNDIYLNISWWNCSCSDLNMTFVSSNQDISNWTWFNDSCYAIIHNVSNEPLTPGSMWEIWFIVNITNCSGVTTAAETLNITGNATELTEDVTVAGDDAPEFNWGTTADRVCVSFDGTVMDVGATANSVFVILGIILIIGSILLILGIVKKWM